MKEILKLLFDICFYYTLSGFYMYIFTGNTPSGWGAAVLILTAGAWIVFDKLRKNKINTDERKEINEEDTAEPGASRRVVLSKGLLSRTGSILFCALPGIIFLFELSMWQFIQYIPAWVYLGYTIWSNKLYTDRAEFLIHFKFTGKILCFMMFGMVIFSRVGGAVAGAIFGTIEKKAAIEAGFYVLEQSGDTMKMDIPDDFVPRDF